MKLRAACVVVGFFSLAPALSAQMSGDTGEAEFLDSRPNSNQKAGKWEKTLSWARSSQHSRFVQGTVGMPCDARGTHNRHGLLRLAGLAQARRLLRSA